MSNISQFQVDNTTYDIKDAEARIASSTISINPSITDSADGLIQDLTVYGESRTSKNLLDLNAITSGYAVSTSNGNLYADSNLFATNYIDVHAIPAIICHSGSNDTNVWGAFYDQTLNFVRAFNHSKDLPTYIPEDAYYVRITFLIADEAIAMVEVGETPTSYEPYFSGIHGIGESGTLNVQTCGKNLFGGIYGEIYDFDQIIPNGTSVAISFKRTGSGACTVHLYKANSDTRYDYYTIGGTSRVVTLGQDTGRVLFSGNDVGAYDIQFELGSTPTTYEPYVSSSAVVTTGMPLYAVNNVKDEKSGVIIKRCEKVVFDGSEEWYQGNPAYRFYLRKPNAKLGTNLINDAELRASADPNGTHTICISPISNINSIDIRYDKTITTLNDWKTYLASNPVTVVYELAEPYEIPLTDTELSALRGLKTFNPITNITVTDNPTIEIEYLLNTNNGQAVADIQTDLQGQIDDVGTDLESGLARKTDLSVIAEPYDSTKTYSDGDIFEYNGELWQVIYAQFMNVNIFRGIEKVEVGSIFKRIQITTSDQLPVESIPGNSFVFTTDDNEKIWLNTISITNPVLRTDSTYYKYFVEVFCTFVKATSFRQGGVIIAKNDLTGIDNIEDANNILKIQKINDEYVVTYANSSMLQWTGSGQSSYSFVNISKGTSPIGYIRGYAVFINDDNTETVMYTPCKLLSLEET